MSIPSLRILSPTPPVWPDAVVDRPAPCVPIGRRQRRPLGRLLLVSDLLAAGAAGMAAGILVVVAPSISPAGTTAAARLAFLPAWPLLVVLVLAARGTYTAARRRLSPAVADEILSLLAGIATAGLVLLAAGAVGPLAGRVPLGDAAMFIGCSLVLVPAFRAVALALVANDRSRVARVIVVGSGRVAGELARRLDRSALVEVVGTVDDDPAESHDVLGTVDDLPSLCRAMQADRVIIAFSRRHPSRSAELVLALRDVVEVDVVVRYFELAGWESRLHDVAGLSLLNLGGRPGLPSLALKRLLDIAVAAVALVLLLPLMALVAVAIWAESGGPVLFRQARVGRHRRPFHILKFRTMADAGSAVPGQAGGGRPTGGRRSGGVGEVRPIGAPRTPLDGPDPDLVTGIGRFLRRTGLDELPQLVNILRGEMSLVGPRPFIHEECVALGGWALRRFDVRPGMTGMWQVCGQHEVSFDELCRLDVQYATSWSLRTDLRILARTPARLVHGSAPGR